MTHHDGRLVVRVEDVMLVKLLEQVSYVTVLCPFKSVLVLAVQESYQKIV